MATVTKPEAYNGQDALCEDLRLFLESNNHPEHGQIQEIIQKVEEIKTRILSIAHDGKISAEGTFPQDKLIDAKQYVAELQLELQKVFGIHQAVSKRWALQKIAEGIPEATIQSAVITVLTEYQESWSNMN